MTAFGSRSRLAFGSALSLWLLYLMFRDVDWRILGSTAFSVSPTLLLAAIIVLGIDYFFRLLRWHSMLHVAGSNIALRQCARPLLIGFALNNLLPLRAGDVARVVAFQAAIGISRAHILGTLVVERLFDLLVLLAILGVSLAWAPMQGDTLAWARPIAIMAGAGLLGILAICLALALSARIFAGLSMLLLWLLGSTRGQRVLERIEQLRSALLLLADPRALATFVALSTLAWVLEGFVFGLVALALAQDTAGIWLAMAVGNLGTLLPGAPGHFGTFDFFAMHGLMAFDVAHETAAGFALLVHLILWVPVTLVGLVLIRLAPPGLRRENHEQRA